MADRTFFSFLLDRTGSMSSVRDATISAFNEFVAHQVSLEGATAWTLTIFDSESIDVLYRELAGADVPKLTPETYLPRANTPLFDAIGSQAKLARETVEADGAYDAKVFVIQTDGEENASKEYRIDDVRSLVKALEDEGWQIIYLGAGIDAYQAGTFIGASQFVATSYIADDVSTQAAFAAASGATFAFRRTGRTQSVTQKVAGDDVQTNANDPMLKLKR